MEKYPVKSKIQNKAKLKSFEEYSKMYKFSLEKPEDFWKEQAKRLTWDTFPTQIKEGEFNNVNHKWFIDGKLNASANCLDRHLEKLGDRTAIIWAKDEPGEYEKISYLELHEKVCQLANWMEDQGIQKGDRVCLYLPMIPELAISVLACARIGAIHSVVFAGFSAEALRDRINDASCKLLITANEGLRGGKIIPLKQISDEALKNANSIEKVLVVNRTMTKVSMNPRDINYEEIIPTMPKAHQFQTMDAEDPLFILYTSGSTGKPKGVQHTTGGYLTYASMTHEYVFDYHPGDIYFCAADIGWVTGHSYIIYGPLCNGATTVMFESTPVYPDASRYWQIIEDLKVNIFYTAPTALRTLAQQDSKFYEKHDLSSLRVIGSVGEPINPEIWKWYHDEIGKKECAVVDTWWQTETGGILITPLPGVTETKAGSATLPFFGIEPVLVEPESGKLLEGNNVEGALCIKHSWPGQARTIYGDHNRFKKTYFTQYPGLYFTGDGCTRDEDGYYWITGRIDDVLNCSGHRLGTAEIESSLIEHPEVAEAAVVGYPHDIKGVGIFAYLILQNPDSIKKDDAFFESVKDSVREGIGRFACPDKLLIIPGLPKTRSGKVMRRILRKIAHGEIDSIGDTSTLADPSVVEMAIEEFRKIQR